MKPLWAALTALLLPLAVQGSSGRPGYGLIGYGISMYKPPCAYACKDSISNPLNCDEHADHHMRVVRRMSGMDMEKPSPECHASNEPYLQTLAYCMSTHCEDVEVWKLERFWKMNVAGRALHQPSPKMTYQEALESIDEAPSKVTPAEEMLHGVSLVDEETYLSSFNGDHTFEIHEGRTNRYCLVLILTCAILPIFLSCLRWLPVPGHLATRFSATFIDPPLFGSNHQVPFLNAFHIPSRGQGLFIAYLLAINIVLSAVDYEATSPNSWYDTRTRQIASYISNRTGALSAANLSLLVLFAGRNNFLLWLTNWSHSTFLLLHRWIAGIAAVQACLHSAIYLQIYVVTYKDFTAESKLDYWSWGVVSTIAMVALLPASMYYIRKRWYELFLVLHIVLAFFAIIGYYYHIYLRFGRQWGYELWAYIAIAIWAFDRVVRILRIARNGIRTGRVTVVNEDYVRLDVPGVYASGQAYLTFPTLTWRVWENHPFSVAGSLLTETTTEHDQPSTASSNEKTPAQITAAAIASETSSTSTPIHARRSTTSSKPGLTFFIRTHDGLTRHLRNRTTLPVLIESSYGHSLLHNQHEELDKYQRLVCVAGGVGITAVLPILAKHGGVRKLYWGLRSKVLEEATRDLFETDQMTGVEKVVKVGERLALQEVLEKEVDEAERYGQAVGVVVSGPAAMADEVRRIVVGLAKEGSKRRVEVGFVEECYSW